MSALPARLQEILDELAECFDAEEKLEELIAWGEKLEQLPPERRQPELRVPGCVSNVHVETTLEDGKLAFSASADALIVRGIVAILVEGLSGLSLAELEEVDPAFLKEVGLTGSLTPSRANATLNIVLKMKEQARAVGAS